MTTTRQLGSAAAVSSALRKSASMARVKALSLLGRFKVSCNTPPLTVFSTFGSLTGISPLTAIYAVLARLSPGLNRGRAEKLCSSGLQRRPGWLGMVGAVVYSAARYGGEGYNFVASQLCDAPLGRRRSERSGEGRRVLIGSGR